MPAENIVIALDARRRGRLELLSKELEVDFSGAISEAIDVLFRRLVTEGRIPVEASYSGIEEGQPETEYSLEDSPDLHDSAKWGLTSKERASFGKAQAKNAEKAEQGDPKAQNVMGTYYESGNGVAKDYDKAIYWYTLAAEQGNTNAQYHLAVLYNKVKDNPLKSYMWFEVARMCGFNITHIHQDYIIRLTERLSPSQIKIAQEEAARRFKA